MAFDPYDNFILRYLLKFGKIPENPTGRIGGGAGPEMPRGVTRGFGQPSSGEILNPQTPKALPRTGTGYGPIVPRQEIKFGDFPKAIRMGGGGGKFGPADAGKALGKAGAAAAITEVLTGEGGPINWLAEKYGEKWEPTVRDLTEQERMFWGDAPLSTYDRRSAEESGLVGDPRSLSPESKSVEHQKVEAINAAIEAEKQAAQAAEAAETERLQKQAMASSLDLENWVQPSLGEDQTLAGKLMAIRVEARARGRAGSLGADPGVTMEDYTRPPSGGTFSQAAPSPELEARLRDRDEWEAGQDMRNQEFLASPEQARRNPELAQSAAQRITEMKAAQLKEQELANQQALIASLAQGGKVPFDTAMQLQMSGLPVPFEMRGMSPDESTRKIQESVAGAQAFLARMVDDPTVGGMNPEGKRAFLNWLIQSAPQYLQMAQDRPDEAYVMFEQMAQLYDQQTGAFAEWRAQGPTQVGE